MTWLVPRVTEGHLGLNIAGVAKGCVRLVQLEMKCFVLCQ